MADASSPFDASMSALGYIHQCRSALLLGLQRFDDPNACISIEKLDDVALHASADTLATASELRQYKLHIKRQGGLGNKSPDIWRTLRVWSEAIVQGRIVLERGTFCLVTTSQAEDANAVRLLRPTSRDPETARVSLETAGAESRNQTVIDAYASLMRLTEPQRQSLFESIFLLDNALSATDIRGEIVKHLWFVPPRHRTSLAESLEGWWLELLTDHLASPSVQPILIHVIQQKVQNVIAQFRRDSLPDHLLDESIPEGAIPENDDRMFIRQLLLIGLSEARRRFAQEDHYRAFTQRSRWVKDQLLGFDEEEKFESRLINCWKERFEIMREGIGDQSDANLLAGHGSSLYEWIVTEAPSRSQLWFRPDFQSEYMMKGSFHLLADALRVGWHPHFKEELTPVPSSPKPARRKRRVAK